MDLVDLIAEKRFIGQEFLTWLWFKSEQRSGFIEVAGMGDIGLIFEKHLLLESGEGESFEKIVCQGLQAELREGRTGLKMGKKLEQARLRLTRGEYEWLLTLKGSLLEYRSVKLPRTVEGVDEGDDPLAVEGRILDRIGLLETVVGTIDELFRIFLELRTGSDWPEERQALAKWIDRVN